MPTKAAPLIEDLTDKLIEVSPPNARHVLALGVGHDAVRERYLGLWPDASWTAADALRADSNTESPRYDLVLLGPHAMQLRDSQQLLDCLLARTTPAARLICSLPNMGHHAVLQRLVLGDISYDLEGPMDQAHARWFSPASAFKMLLDGGWLPHLQAQCRTDVPETVFSSRLLGAAMALGVPRQTALRNLGLQHMIVVCEKQALRAPTAQTRYAPFSVIVPVNRPLELELNIRRSPGLLEVGAQVISVDGATSAADAFAQGAAQATHAWRLFVHQDVYFPTGSGFTIAEQLGAMEQSGRAGAPVGFAGLEGAADLQSGLRYAGQVIDRTTLFNHPGSVGAVSIDEFAVALHRDSPVALDPALGWHLWATDLCLQAMLLGGAPCAQILRAPLFHNSTTGYNLPVEFQESGQVLLHKYQHLRQIPTLCGVLNQPQQAMAA